MRKLVTIAVAASLGACATASPSDGIRQLGKNQFSISEMHFLGGDVVGRAAAYCTSLGQRLQVEGDTTQTGAWSGNKYAMLIFSCQDVPR
jgi:hypothetical protein